MSYNNLTLNERIFLQKCLKTNISYREIARYLGRNVSTISREISRNSINGEYIAFKSNEKAVKRKHTSYISALKPNTEEYKYVVSKLELYWSPEIIAIRWKREYPDKPPLSYSTIYRHIKKGLFENITDNTHLRRRGNPYKSRETRSNSVTIHPDKTINDWTDDIINRQNTGDFEGDSILGGIGKGIATTLVDRKSRFVFGIIRKNKTARETRKGIEKILKNVKVKSITFDNGSEFAEFRELEKSLNIDVYFAEPHKPWQRGSNENLNGLLRFFFPKGCDFKKITQKEFQRVLDLINNRPRKCLGGRTPREVYEENVALA